MKNKNRTIHDEVEIDSESPSVEVDSVRRAALEKMGKFAYTAPVFTALLLSSKANGQPIDPSGPPGPPGSGTFP